MILESEIVAIGYVTKLHGIKGEVSIQFEKDIFDEEDVDFFIFDIDGIFVPFFIKDYRFKSDSAALYLFDGLETDERAKLLVGKTVYLHKRFCLKTDNDIVDIQDFIGFTVIDEQNHKIGTITAIDDSTINMLFVLDRNGEELLIPVTEDFITAIDEEQKNIQMNLPEGLLNFDLAVGEE